MKTKTVNHNKGTYQMEDELISRFDYCGCGQPRAVLELLRDVMGHLEMRQKRIGEIACFDSSEWHDECKKIDDAAIKIIIDSPEAVLNLIYYILDKYEVIEHGGSVLSSWISDHEFYQKLCAFVDENRETTE